MLGAALATALVAVAIAGSASAQETIKIGLLANLEGPFAVARRRTACAAPSWRVKQHNGMAGGKKIEIIKVSSDATPDKAVAATRKAVEQDKVQIMIGPLSGDEGIAVKNYAKTQPEHHLHQRLVGRAGHDAAATRRRTSTASTPKARSGWSGLGEHALAKGYKKMFLIAEDYGFPYSQVQGFMASYCAKGGKVVDKAWVPLGTKDYSSVIAKIPQGRRRAGGRAGRLRRGELPQPVRAGRRRQADGRRLDHGRPDGAELQGQAPRIAARHGVGRSDGRRASTRPSGRSSSPTTRRHFQDGFPSPSLFAYLYYINTKAALDGARCGQGRPVRRPEGLPRRAAEDRASTGPAGDVKIDENRNGDRRRPTSPKWPRRADGSLLQQGVKVVTEHHRRRSACRRPSSRRWASAARDVPDCRK